jgi:hypothetical protein
MADTNENTIGVIAEVTAGTTPATPVFANLRITSETLVANYESLVSQELRPDATVAEVRRTGVSVAGDINFELHKATMMDTLLAAALRGTWASDTLKGGVLKPTYSFERVVQGAVGDGYFRFVGSRIGGLSLSFSPDEMGTGTMSVMGTGHTVDDAIITGATYTAVGSSPPMAGVDVSSLSVSGISGVDYMNMTLEVDLALRLQRKLGSTSARGIGYGKRQVTGTLSAYFEDIGAYEAFVNNASPSIIATVSDGTNSYTITLPKVRFLTGEVPTPGENQDVMVNLNYQAIYDSTLTTDIQIVRT